MRLELGLPFKGTKAEAAALDEVGLSRSHAYADVDEDTKKTLEEIEENRVDCEYMQDFEKLDKIDQDLNKLLQVSFW